MSMRVCPCRGLTEASGHTEAGRCPVDGPEAENSDCWSFAASGSNAAEDRDRMTEAWRVVLAAVRPRRPEAPGSRPAEKPPLPRRKRQARSIAEGMP
jgi:hypothetical protein